MERTFPGNGYCVTVTFRTKKVALIVYLHYNEIAIVNIAYPNSQTHLYVSYSFIAYVLIVNN